MADYKAIFAASDRSAYPPSPCNSICTLDDDKHCLGCGRTLDEISRWSSMSAAEQWCVVTELAVRQGGK